MSDSLRTHGLHAPPQAYLSIINSWNLLKLMSIALVMPSNHLIFCLPLLLPPSVFPNITGFSCESVLHIRWPKNWSFSFSISPSNEYSGLISFIIDWFISLQFKGLSRVFSNTHEHYEIMVFILCPKTLGSLPVLMRISIKKAEVCIAIIITYLIISSW